jgi:hypothetical protein
MAIFLNDTEYKINTNAKILVIRDDGRYLKACPNIRLLIGIIDKATLTKYYLKAKLRQIKGKKGISLTSVKLGLVIIIYTYLIICCPINNKDIKTFPLIRIYVINYLLKSMLLSLNFFIINSLDVY